MPSPADKRKPDALTLTVASVLFALPRFCASTMLPPVAVKLTMLLPSFGVELAAVVIIPTSIAPAAKRRIAPFVLAKRLFSAIFTLPLLTFELLAMLPATTSIVPLLPTPCVRISAVVAKITDLPASTLTLPVLLTMSAFTVMSPSFVDDVSV